MPREKRSNLAQKLAIVALGAATLAIAYAGQLPALAYGPPPPPPVAPGGFQSVVTSTTVGPAGATIAINIGPCKASLRVPPGTFTTQVQLTITAPSVAGIGNAGHPGYHAICGIGVGITVNGKIYTGTFGHRLTLTISGFAIRQGDRVVVWNGSSFVFVPATVAMFRAAVQLHGIRRGLRGPRARRRRGRGRPVRVTPARRQRRRPQQPRNPGSGSHQPLPHARRSFSGRDRGPGSRMADHHQPLNQRRGAGS